MRGWVKGRPKENYPQSAASSNGLKPAGFGHLQELRSALPLPPFLVPKRVDRDKSAAIGERWAALALS